MKLEAAIDQHKTYEKTISDAKETVKKNDRAYNIEVKKRDAARAQGTTLKLKVTIGNSLSLRQIDRMAVRLVNDSGQ